MYGRAAEASWRGNSSACHSRGEALHIQTFLGNVIFNHAQGFFIDVQSRKICFVLFPIGRLNSMDSSELDGWTIHKK